MKDVYIASDNIISPLGFTTAENMSNISKNLTGIKNIQDTALSSKPFFASLINNQILAKTFASIDDPNKYTKFEQLALLSITDALSTTDIDVTSKKTLFVLSTTKGNIDLLEKNKKELFPQKRIFIWNTAKLIQSFFNNPNQPVIVSNACISGVIGLITAERLLQTTEYENIIITGVDIISEFVVSGFLSFKSLSIGPCKPFDKSRDGLSLGEGCGTIILTTKQPTSNKNNIKICAGAVSNDANHISGPSRTGEGLWLAIQNTLKRNNNPSTIDYISAHGTATPYNDEMEAKAISWAGLESTPVNSLKGFFGHTLGAAGIIESIVATHSLRNNLLFETKGFNETGISKNINIIKNTHQKKINNCLKLASGFGGCNAAVLFIKQ